MNESAPLEGFLHKWRERWPEWRVAAVFVAPDERDVAVAWQALLQELADAAWAGSDPRPGEAKLGWWAEELHGWTQGRRRHPLGQLLQSRPAPWTSLAATLPAWLESREPAANAGEAASRLAPIARGIAAIEPVLFAAPAGTGTVDSSAGSRTSALLARQLLLQGDAAAPLHLRARMSAPIDAESLARAWARELLAGWPPMQAGARTVRVFGALLRGRLHRYAGGRARGEPLSALGALHRTWRAARG